MQTNLIEQKVRNKTRKMLVKYWQDMKNFVEKISTKFTGFYLNKMNLVQNVLQTRMPKFR